jgi:hypothetical protein
MGVERIAMMKYGISEIGSFTRGYAVSGAIRMKILTRCKWLSMKILPNGLGRTAGTAGGRCDAQLAEDLTLRGIAVEGIYSISAKATARSTRWTSPPTAWTR